MSELRHWVIGCDSEASWDQINALLTQSTTGVANVPDRMVEISDLKEHSPDRATYLLTDAEAEAIKQLPGVTYVHVDRVNHRELYEPPLPWNTRYSTAVKNYFNTGPAGASILPTNPTSADLNRAGYQLLRLTQFANPWLSANIQDVILNPVPAGPSTGANVDLVLADDGCWFGHVEFQNNTGNGPQDYQGGNVLPGNGTCDLLDLLLDSPYYIDPAWFNADPASRLITRWDGTVVPVESVARAWWSTSSQRSLQFRDIGVVAVGSSYSRARSNGSNTARPTSGGGHGTPCGSQLFGRTYGWAYNANKWVINAISIDIALEQYLDIVKLFHLYKPVNPNFGTRDPTMTSNSYGYRLGSFPSSGFYYFRSGVTGAGATSFTNVTYPAFFNPNNFTQGISGDMLPNSMTAAGDEAVAAGVIFFTSSGNQNQTMVSFSDPDFNNYWNGEAQPRPLETSQHTEGGFPCLNTINRRGFPEQIGKFQEAGSIQYPVICAGALDDQFQGTAGNFRERKANYSNRGSSIDAFTPAENTLAASVINSGRARFDSTYPGSSLISFDETFGGTSSACPVLCGFIATLVSLNRNWTWRDIKAYLANTTEQPETQFYQGGVATDANSPSWADFYSMQSARRTVPFLGTSPVPPPPQSTFVSFSGLTLTLSGGVGAGTGQLQISS